ncbi:hypothetical protein CSC67_07560 [Pusillimonas caeni]|uniref:tyrosine-type recombinase/integrase n=1 Tax=Pusillimonas caeni TaxID=1348472 RepID=UPI000E599D9A|nr:tyrosine-type recombinase/integrase [Pusillimonas caeni]TFL14021.1 hypothetical protein CSC67_07560 [Pusillimonas caeni]
MGRSKTSGIYPSTRYPGEYEVDALYRGQRIRKCGFSSKKEAEDFLIEEKQQIQAQTTKGQRPKVLLVKAAARYIKEQAAANKSSWVNDASMLKPLLESHSSLTLDEICDEALKDFVDARRAEGLKGRTINATLELVRTICIRASTTWKFKNKVTWLDRPPQITFVDESDSRPPRPLGWAEQDDKLMPKLKPHIKKAVLFKLNSGVREKVVCNLRWKWEVRIEIRPELTISAFVIPRRYVKGRKYERVVFCNSVAQQVVDEQRGLHPTRVFCWPKPIGDGQVEYEPFEHINNTSWQNSVAEAGLGDLRVHDLRHTVGMRLRAAGVPKRTQDTILWHVSGDMGDHYAIAQIREVYDALELITRPQDSFESIDLHALIRQTRMEAFTADLPQQDLAPCKKTRKAA